MTKHLQKLCFLYFVFAWVFAQVTIKIWDMGGQKKFRGMWERYCRGVQVIVFVIDAADQKLFTTAHKELQALLVLFSTTFWAFLFWI